MVNKLTLNWWESLIILLKVNLNFSDPIGIKPCVDQLIVAATHSTLHCQCMSRQVTVEHDINFLYEKIAFDYGTIMLIIIIEHAVLIYTMHACTRFVATLAELASYSCIVPLIIKLLCNGHTTGKRG